MSSVLRVCTLVLFIANVVIHSRLVRALFSDQSPINLRECRLTCEIREINPPWNFNVYGSLYLVDSIAVLWLIFPRSCQVYSLLLKHLDYPCVALHSLMSQVQCSTNPPPVCTRYLVVSLGAKASFTSQVQVGSSQNSCGYGRCKQVSERNAVVCWWHW